MRLTFSSSDYQNADLADESGRVLYTTQTTTPFGRTVAIRKHTGGSLGGSEELAVINWHIFRTDEIHFGGQVIKAGDMLKRRRWFSSDYYFTGPDGRAYKWNLRSSNLNCVLQPEGSDEELAKYHNRNLGIRSPSHPPYLEISPSVTHILDYIIVTFVYIETLSQAQQIAEVGAGT
ncbi:hypothetical protein BDN67DRAFT_1067575 [Paxillus ammoniavirescens]|nr:hypothetical protein BDN67DRAFT_1067575 [Paxillus ammoniavirescens]